MEPIKINPVDLIDAASDLVNDVALRDTGLPAAEIRRPIQTFKLEDGTEMELVVSVRRVRQMTPYLGED